MRVIEVGWDDISSINGWKKREVVDANASPIFCRSVGYLYKDDGENVVLVQSMSDENDTVAECICIPKTNIRYITWRA